MPNYQNGKIYTIRCKTNKTLIYVGSTTVSLSKRFYGHKLQNYKNSFHTNVDDWNDWYIELLEYFPCNSKEELCKREGEMIREIGTLNIHIPNRTPDELKQYHKNRKHVYNTSLPDDKREKLNLKRSGIKCICECGEEINKDRQARHRRSTKHLEKMSAISSTDLVS